MSVYNHRSMVPHPRPSHILEVLDSIRPEIEQLVRKVEELEADRAEYERTMKSQIQEMQNINRDIKELEVSQQMMKRQYEEEIARLRHQLDQTRHSKKADVPAPRVPDQAPPEIGSSTNHFGGIMNPRGSQNDMAPPHMDHYPMGSYPPPQPSSYQNGAAPPPGQVLPPAPYGGHPYSSHGTPQPRPLSQPSDPSMGKRKPAAPPMPGPTGPPAPSVPQTQPGSLGSWSDVDPESVPANMKIEGSDWFALFNPKARRSLKIDLVHTEELSSVVCCVKFSADGRYLAAGCNCYAKVYDVETFKRICNLEHEQAGSEDLYIRSVCFSPDGRFLATGAEDKKIRIWDIATQTIYKVLTGHDQDIYSLDFSRDGRIIASGSGDRTARIWSVADGALLHTLLINEPEVKDPGVTSVAISPDGRLVAAGSLDKMVRVWDIETGKLKERLEGHKDSVYSVAFMPDNKTLISGSLDKTLKLWQLGSTDRAKGPCKMTFSGHKDFVLSVACTPDGAWVVSGSKDRSVQFWDPRTGQTQIMLQGHKNSVISVAISPSGRRLFATGSGDNRARIWSYDPVPFES